jgi:hypothetical protein
MRQRTKPGPHSCSEFARQREEGKEKSLSLGLQLHLCSKAMMSAPVLGLPRPCGERPRLTLQKPPLEPVTSQIRGRSHFVMEYVHRAVFTVHTVLQNDFVIFQVDIEIVSIPRSSTRTTLHLSHWTFDSECDPATIWLLCSSYTKYSREDRTCVNMLRRALEPGQARYR